MQIAEQRSVHAVASQSLQVVEQIVLTRLAEGQAIDCEAALEPGESRVMLSQLMRRQNPE